MMRYIGVNHKIVNIIEELYKNTECAIVINGQLTEWFKVEVGVRQGCIMSPTLFNIFLEFVMDELVNIDPVFTLKDDMSAEIRYADDTTLLSAIFNKLKLTTLELENACSKWGMKINSSKCKILTKENDEIYINNNEVEQVNEFTFLGSIVPGTTSDVKRRINLASSSFGRLSKTIWQNAYISIKLKVRLYKALILPIATYACETWTLKAADTQRLLVFEMKCLRSILKVSLRDHLRNDIIRLRLGVEETIIENIRKRRLKWFGHVNRRYQDSLVYKAYHQDFQNPRPRRRPEKRWSDQIKEFFHIVLCSSSDPSSIRLIQL